MKALIKKDFFTVLKSMKVFLLLFLLFAIIPDSSASSFAIVYAAMLPLTALAYDERSKWDSLAVTMPYSPLQIVASKYLLGYLGIMATFLLTLLAQTVIKAFSLSSSFGLETLIVSMCAGLLMLALSLPFSFRFGVEKGRLALMALIVAGVLSISAFAGNRITQLSNQQGSFALILPVILLSVTMLNVGSILLSARFYQARRS